MDAALSGLNTHKLVQERLDMEFMKDPMRDYEVRVDNIAGSDLILFQRDGKKIISELTQMPKDFYICKCCDHLRGENLISFYHAIEAKNPGIRGIVYEYLSEDVVKKHEKFLDKADVLSKMEFFNVLRAEGETVLNFMTKDRDHIVKVCKRFGIQPEDVNDTTLSYVADIYDAFGLYAFICNRPAFNNYPQAFFSAREILDYVMP